METKTVKSKGIFDKDNTCTFKLLATKMKESYSGPFHYDVTKEEVIRVLSGMKRKKKYKVIYGKDCRFQSVAILNNDGSIDIGCQRFSKTAVAKIRKWAFAKKKKAINGKTKNN